MNSSEAKGVHRPIINQVNYYKMTSTDENVEEVVQDTPAIPAKDIIESSFSVDPDAESTLNTLATIVRGYFEIISLLLFILGAIGIYKTDESWWWILAVLGVCIVVDYIGELLYARIKIFVNISRSLYNIEERLKRIENKE